MYDKDIAGEWIFGELLTKFIGGVYHNFRKDGSCHSRGETHVTQPVHASNENSTRLPASRLLGSSYPLLGGAYSGSRIKTILLEK